METDDKNSRKSLKRRKSSSEKSSHADESGIKSKRKRKESTEQNAISQHNEKENLLKIKTTEDDNCENYVIENSNTENQDYTSDKKLDATNKKNLKKKKHSSKSTGESDVKDDSIEQCDTENRDSSDKNAVDNNSQRKKKGMHSLEDTEKSDIKDDNAENDDVEGQDVSEKETDIVDNNGLKRRKRKHSLENTEECDVKSNDIENCCTESQDVCEKNPDTMDGRSSKKKKRLSRSTDENEFRDNITENSNAENCNVENQEVPNKTVTRTKSGEKKKKRVSINNSIENSAGEKKDSHGRHSKAGSDMEEREVKADLKKKKKRKRNKSKEDDICNLLGLQVMAKPDWKRLRNKYLDLQRSKMSLLKQHLRKTEMERGEIMTKKKWNNDKIEQDCENRLKDEKENETEVMDVEEPSYGRLTYTPGVIVKIEMDEPCTDPQRFKVFIYKLLKSSFSHIHTHTHIIKLFIFY